MHLFAHETWSLVPLWTVLLHKIADHVGGKMPTFSLILTAILDLKIFIIVLVVENDVG